MQQLELAEWLTNQQGVKVSQYVLLVTPVMVTGCGGYTHASVGPDGRLYDRPKTASEMALIYLKSHAVVYSRVRNAARTAGIGVVPTRDTPFFFHVFGADRDEQTVRSDFQNCVARFRDFAAAHGAKLSLVYVPLTVEVDFTAVAQAAEHRHTRVDADLPFRICSTVAADLNLPLVDLRPVLKEFQSRNQPLHLKGDYHYDAAVSQACGREVWVKLEENLNQSGRSES